jgi:hypothetical protein
MKTDLINVPTFLHEIHGRTQTKSELLITYSVGVFTTILVIVFLEQGQFSLGKQILLIALTLDIASGVVANCTQGTSDYYAENSTRRWIFLALHITQPLLLTWLFPEDIRSIALIAAFTLIFGSIVNILKGNRQQRGTAVSLLMVVFVCMTLVITFTNKIAFLLMLLYSTKIILAFAVRWNERNLI